MERQWSQSEGVSARLDCAESDVGPAAVAASATTSTTARIAFFMMRAAGRERVFQHTRGHGLMLTCRASTSGTGNGLLLTVVQAGYIPRMLGYVLAIAIGLSLAMMGGGGSVLTVPIF